MAKSLALALASSCQSIVWFNRVVAFEPVPGTLQLARLDKLITKGKKTLLTLKFWYIHGFFYLAEEPQRR